MGKICPQILGCGARVPAVLNLYAITTTIIFVGVLQSERRSDEYIRYTIQIFPHRNFLRILETTDLTCQIYFTNGSSSRDLDVPKTSKDSVTFDLPSLDRGEAELVVIRQENSRNAWLLDCVTGIALRAVK